MSNVILGIIDNDEYRLEFTKDNAKSKHMGVRKDRLELSLDSAGILYYYEVYRVRDNCRQVHCLYEDATLIIFNKRTKKIITIMLLNRKELASYLEVTEETLSEHPILRRCAKVHERIPDGDISKLAKEDSEDIKTKKLKYMRGG